MKRLTDKARRFGRMITREAKKILYPLPRFGRGGNR